jgi:hypothetical protein
MKFDVSLTSQLSSKGSDVTESVSLTDSKDVKSAVLRWLNDAIDAMNKAVDRYDATATLNLRQSFRASDFRLDGQALKIDLEGAEYWAYVNYGVDGVENKRGRPFSFRYIRPSKRHVAAIRKWAIDKAIGIPAEELNSAAYLMARSIKRRGIEARPFYTDTMTDKRVNELTVTIADITGKQISLKLLSTFEK